MYINVAMSTIHICCIIQLNSTMRSSFLYIHINCSDAYFVSSGSFYKYDYNIFWVVFKLLPTQSSMLVFSKTAQQIYMPVLPKEHQKMFIGAYTHHHNLFINVGTRNIICARLLWIKDIRVISTRDKKCSTQSSTKYTTPAMACLFMVVHKCSQLPCTCSKAKFTWPTCRYNWWQFFLPFNAIRILEWSKKAKYCSAVRNTCSFYICKQSAI